VAGVECLPERGAHHELVVADGCEEPDDALVVLESEVFAERDRFAAEVASAASGKIPLMAIHPLRSWTLRGFRSIRDQTVFELGGLTVLVGANSAGKSSVLHSLLMCAQTLGNPLADRPLVLNGPLVRLGLASDTVHEASGRHIELGFGLVPVEDSYASGMWRGGFKRLDVRAVLEVTPNGQDFRIHETEVTAEVDEPLVETQQLIMRRRTRSAAEQAYRKQRLSRDAARKAAQRGSLDVAGDPLPNGTAGVRSRQFLPQALSVVVNEYEKETERLIEHYLRLWNPRHNQPPRAVAHEHVSTPVRRLLRSYLIDELGANAADLIPNAGTLTVGSLLAIDDAEVVRHLRNLTRSPWLLEHVDQLEFRGVVDSAGLPSAIDNGLEYARRWFANRVQHLGPLRADPQPLYGLPEAASGTAVGRSGEYTASVLSAHAGRMVRSPDPNGGPIRDLPLGAAVDEWMQALGLLSGVRSQERGKLGYELQLNVEGVRRSLDLTTVGVGVSQALPIVVLGLIASPGALLLFEQPELHLHPDVQATLGDFFLALVRSGRQLVVETHSEYLINRLRRRAATNPELGVPDIVRLYFFERTRAASKVQAARIGPGGSMTDWPRGFLDTAAREVREFARGVRQENDR
jgi:predicted ATPase